MIIALIYIVASLFIQGFTQILAALNFIPAISSLIGSVNYFLSFTAYFYGVLDVARIFIDAGLVIAFELFWFGFLTIWWVIGFFRSMFSVGAQHNH